MDPSLSDQNHLPEPSQLSNNSHSVSFTSLLAISVHMMVHLDSSMSKPCLFNTWMAMLLSKIVKIQDLRVNWSIPQLDKYSSTCQAKCKTIRNLWWMIHFQWQVMKKFQSHLQICKIKCLLLLNKMRIRGRWLSSNHQYLMEFAKSQTVKEKSGKKPAMFYS